MQQKCDPYTKRPFHRKLSREATPQQLGMLGYLEYKGRKPRTVKEADQLIRTILPHLERAQAIHVALDREMDMRIWEDNRCLL